MAGLRSQEIIDDLLKHCPSVTRVSKAEANRLGVCDDFKHMSSGVYIEQKLAKTTANQVHPLKAGVLICSISKEEHIVVTMAEAFQYICRQHAISAWECGSISISRLKKDFPITTNETLNDFIEFKVSQYLDDEEFRARQSKAMDICNKLMEELNAV